MQILLLLGIFTSINLHAFDNNVGERGIEDALSRRALLEAARDKADAQKN